ncbi:DUF6191 domain-containing protein [Streptomyces sp. CBMA156]|uniref:DUF6191 domain-containing protein n=1 Tax=Streptomyces sp. CBMA156 TaxID=1930280 RepID=UPI001661C3AB|nr:DUF6191 domain-containing protein [Streptomyces sp. CBMA156]MBD0671971.1 hypothetical protein [Streptomyces sp. CBMA156]
MGLIVGVAAAVVVVLGLVLLAAWQVLDESSSRPRQRGPGVGMGAGGLEELHALFSPGKQVQVEQKHEQLVLRDDAQAGALPHLGVDLDRGVAVLRGGAAGRTPEPAPHIGSGTGTTGQAPLAAGVQASQLREQSTSR